MHAKKKEKKKECKCIFLAEHTDGLHKDMRPQAGCMGLHWDKPISTEAGRWSTRGKRVRVTFYHFSPRC